MNTQYYYSRHGEHTAASDFHRFSHWKNVKTKAQEWWSPHCSPAVVHGAPSFELGLPASKPVICLLVPLGCTAKATREAVSSHSMLGGRVWGQRDCEKSLSNQRLEMMLIGNSSIKETRNEWAQQACSALGLGKNLLQLALGSSKCREEGFSGHWVSGKAIHVASLFTESQPRAFGRCQRLIPGF